MRFGSGSALPLRLLGDVWHARRRSAGSDLSPVIEQGDYLYKDLLRVILLALGTIRSPDAPLRPGSPKKPQNRAVLVL